MGAEIGKGAISLKKRIISVFLALALALSLCVGASAAGGRFPDAEGHWAEAEIAALAAQGIVRGFPDGTVRPDQAVSRAEFVALTARAFGYAGSDAAAPFDDLAGCWAVPEIAALAAAGIVRAAEYGGSFDPARPITRAEAARLLVRAVDPSANCADDADCVRAATGRGILKGYPDGSLGLGNTATRAEVFATLIRAQAARAQAEAEKKAEAEKPQAGASGGCCAPPVPAAELTFTLPEAAYAGESAEVSAVAANAVSVVWKLALNGAEAALPENFRELGGELVFSEAGTYELTGTAKNSAGRETVCTRSVRVYPVPTLALALPAAAHTDAAADVSLTGELCGLPVVWTLTKNGEAVELPDAAEGTLSDTGGALRFRDKGVYRLTAAVTDAPGRTFSVNAEITVYPVGEIGLYLPEIFHTDETALVAASFVNCGGDVAWTLERDGAAVPLADYVSGELTADGGRITVAKPGSYTLTAACTDAAGRTYRHSRHFRVYPVPTLSFSFAGTAHTDTPVAVRTTSTNLDGLSVVWLTDNTAGVQNWDACIDGTLDKDGGTIRFKHAGSYTLTAAATDATGRVFLFESAAKCVVLPVLELRFELPALLYTDSTANIRTLGSNNILPVVWTLTRNGAPVRLADALSGDLNAYGGDVRFRESGVYKLTAACTDALGRTFSTGTETRVLPLIGLSVAAPAQAHVGAAFPVSVKAENLGANALVWTLTRNGQSAAYGGSLANDGGSVSIGTVGTCVLTASVTDEAGRAFAARAEIEVGNAAPDAPSLSVQKTRTVAGGKFLVSVSAAGTDSDGDAVTLEYDGVAADGYYAEGTHTVRARAVDCFGLTSAWTAETFTVSNAAPSTPVIARSPNGNCVAPGTAVNISASAADPDGDAITYVWENRPAESHVYGLGKQVVRVKAVDAAGAESPWAAIIFFVASSSNGGGMTLTGADSTILENGIAGATITSFTFTVPPVDGHNGSDYGRVRGYNRKTGAWDQLAYQTTTNGVTLTGKMEAGIYTRLEFYYYTNHNCMYNKSNITYSVDFFFE